MSLPSCDWPIVFNVTPLLFPLCNCYVKVLLRNTYVINSLVWFSRNVIFRGFWRMASFDWILNGTSSNIILFATIPPITKTRPILWNVIRWLGVLLEIQSKEVIRQNLGEISFYSENFWTGPLHLEIFFYFSVRSGWFSSSMHFFIWTSRLFMFKILLDVQIP